MLTQKQKGLLFLILAVAAALRFIGLVPNVLHADEGYIQDIAWDLVRNLINKGDFNPHSFKYGSLMFYLQALSAFPILAITYLLEVANTVISSTFTSQILDFSSFHNEAVRKYVALLVFFGRAQTAIFGVASIYVLYLIGKKLFNFQIGLLSALFLTVSPLHVRDSHYITTDVLSLFAILVAHLCLLYLIDTRKMKWFVLSGLFLGISSTIRYYPVALLVYPFALLFSFSKKKTWFLKTLASFLFIIIGVFLGMPYFFLDPNGPQLFIKDLEKYILPWYSTTLSNFVFSAVASILSSGNTSISNITPLYSLPSSFRPIHASWIFFNGLGPLATIAGLAGIVSTFFTSLRKFTLLIIIPLFTFVYISAYIPSTYERLSIPILPFLAIFAAVFIYHTRLFAKKLWGEKKAQTVFIMVVVLIVLHPLLKSFSANLACSQKSTQNQSHDWVGKNISEQARIGYVTMVSVPPFNFLDWFALEPNQKISLEEATEQGLDHAFINAGRLDYVTYPYFNDFFIPPAKLYENSYYPLVLAEYQSRANLLGKVQKPWMCDSSRIYYYKLPKIIEEGSNEITNVNFNDQKDLESWHIKNYDHTGNATISFNTKNGRAKMGSLEYTQTPYRYTPPRIAYDNIPVKEGEVYTFSAWAKANVNADQTPPTVIARTDFYKTMSSDINGIFRKMAYSFSEKLLLIQEGPTPLFFEKKRQLNSQYTNVDLPGRVVALSPRITLSGENWTRISVTSQAPKDVNFAVMSIQSVSTNGSILYLDDMDILKDKNISIQN